MLIFKGKKKSASELSPEEWILHPHEPGLDEEKAFQSEKAQEETGKKTRRVCVDTLCAVFQQKGRGKGEKERKAKLLSTSTQHHGLEGDITHSLSQNNPLRSSY